MFPLSRNAPYDINRVAPTHRARLGASQTDPRGRTRAPRDGATPHRTRHHRPHGSVTPSVEPQERPTWPRGSTGHAPRGSTASRRGRRRAPSPPPFATAAAHCRGREERSGPPPGADLQTRRAKPRLISALRSTTAAMHGVSWCGRSPVMAARLLRCAGACERAVSIRHNAESAPLA